MPFGPVGYRYVIGTMPQSPVDGPAKQIIRKQGARQLAGSRALTEGPHSNTGAAKLLGRIAVPDTEPP
jgi:hypothetical protein